jgi:hypothetical protein
MDKLRKYYQAQAETQQEPSLTVTHASAMEAAGRRAPAKYDDPAPTTRTRVIGTVFATCMLAALFIVPMWLAGENGLFGSGETPGGPSVAMPGAVGSEPLFSPEPALPSPRPDNWDEGFVWSDFEPFEFASMRFSPNQTGKGGSTQYIVDFDLPVIRQDDGFLEALTALEVDPESLKMAAPSYFFTSFDELNEIFNISIGSQLINFPFTGSSWRINEEGQPEIAIREDSRHGWVSIYNNRVNIQSVCAVENETLSVQIALHVGSQKYPGRGWGAIGICDENTLMRTYTSEKNGISAQIIIDPDGNFPELERRPGVEIHFVHNGMYYFFFNHGFFGNPDPYELAVTLIDSFD